MHSNKLNRWIKLFTATFALTALIGFTITVPSQALSSTPTPYCSDGTCWVTFDYTADYSVWTPPSGISSLHFDVYGAQGGRTGGRGGYVSGDFAAIPSMLYVYVGGAGGTGNAVPGGYNGGGTSGSGHGDQGSGGGASDLRASTLSADRIVVAGGGGGTGGWIGGAGGHGGLTVASAGSKGSTAGTAGGGGSQSSGGSAGIGVSGGNGSSGTLNQGGTGGSGTVAGGGGGGGGFYGGGGGGSDSVSGGFDGAGGGGGSSFATMALTTSVSHQSGVRSGNGQVILRYTFAPKVTAFSAIGGDVSNNGSVNYRITFDQYTFDVDAWDFGFSGTATGCGVTSVIPDGYSYDVLVSGCSAGTLNLSLRPLSVFGSAAGPSLEVVSTKTVRIDTAPPAFRLSAPASPTNARSLKYVLTSEEPFSLPTANAFGLLGSGCHITDITMATPEEAVITVDDCASGANAFLTLLKDSIFDSAGNAGPVNDIASADVLVDYESPKVSSITSTSVTADTVQYDVTFSEPVTGVSEDSFVLSGAGCALSKVDGSGSRYQVYVTGCQELGGLTVKSQAASDAAGNLGPVLDETNSEPVADTTAPNAIFTVLDRGDKTVSPSFEIRFDELISGITIDSFSRSGTAKNCTFSLSEVAAGRVYRIDSSRCGSGNLKLTLLDNSVTDSHGNPGPSRAVDSPLEKISPSLQPRLARASFSAFTSTSTTSEPETVLAPTETRYKSIKAAKAPEANPSEFLLATISELKPESWVSLTAAMVALLVAKRPRGRRRAVAIRR